MAYPVADDVKNELIAMGLITNPPTATELLLDWEGELAAAIETWERKTGWKPFIKDSNDVTRNFHPPGSQGRTYQHLFQGGQKILDLEAGLLTLTSLSIGVTTSFAGTSRTVDVDFWLERGEADQDECPYRYVRFLQPQFGPPNSIKIIGKWGFAATCPDDVFQALIHKAAAGVCKKIAIKRLAQPIEWREADVSERYSFEGLNQLGTTLGSEINELVIQYMRQTA